MLLIIEHSYFRIESKTMYIVAIAWLYVVVLMAFTESSITAGVLTFLFFGLVPCALLLWLFGGPSRLRAKRMKQAAEATEANDDTNDLVPDQHMNQHDRANAQADQGKLGN
jgi:hypothetical protein